MKNIVIILITVLALASCTQQKIGYVNTEKLIQDYKGTKAAEEKLKEKSTLIQNQITQVKTAFQDKVQKMSKREVNKNLQKLQQEDNSIKQQEQQAQYFLQGESQKSLEKVSKEVNDFVKKYAKDNGFTFVLGTAELNGSVMYGDEKSDITYDILKKLNKQYIEPSEETEEKTTSDKKNDTTSKTDKKEEKSETKKEEKTTEKK